MLRFLYSIWLDKGRNETIRTGLLNIYEIKDLTPIAIST